MRSRITLKVALGLFVLLPGCSDSLRPTCSPDRKPHSNADPRVDDKGVVRMAVLTDGTAIVNSKVTCMGSLASELDSLGPITEFWYHRESPETAKPHTNALQVITELANRKLPVAMDLDREFTQRVTLAELTKDTGQQTNEGG